VSAVRDIYPPGETVNRSPGNGDRQLPGTECRPGRRDTHDKAAAIDTATVIIGGD